MRPSETIGMLFIAAGVIVGMMEYRLLGLPWFIGAVFLVVLGMVVIWLFAGQRKLRKEQYDQTDGTDDIHPRTQAADEIDISADD